MISVLRSRRDKMLMVAHSVVLASDQFPSAFPARLTSLDLDEPFDPKCPLMLYRWHS